MVNPYKESYGCSATTLWCHSLEEPSSDTAWLCSLVKLELQSQEQAMLVENRVIGCRSRESALKPTRTHLAGLACFNIVHLDDAINNGLGYILHPLNISSDQITVLIL